MKRFLKSKKGVAVLATLVVVGASAFGAYAYFAVGATGTASAGTGDPVALTIVQKGTISGLLPGGPAAPIDFTVNNPNPGNEGLDYVGVTVTGTSTPTCLASWFKVNQNFAAIGEIDAGKTFDSTSMSGGHSGTTVQMIESGAPQNACESATVSLAFLAYP